MWIKERISLSNGTNVVGDVHKSCNGQSGLQMLHQNQEQLVHNKLMFMVFYEYVVITTGHCHSLQASMLDFLSWGNDVMMVSHLPQRK